MLSLEEICYYKNCHSYLTAEYAEHAEYFLRSLRTLRFRSLVTKVMLMKIRKLTQSEIDEVKNIDRSETITHIYYFKKGGLVLEKEHHEVPGWKPEVIAKHIEYLKDLAVRDGPIYGAFDNSKLVGVMALENKFIGKKKDKLELYFMHVSNNYRRKGVGTELFKIAVQEAQKLGAVKLYISASPSKLTTDFYINLSCKLASELIPELFEREPEDIHLEYEL